MLLTFWKNTQTQPLLELLLMTVQSLSLGMNLFISPRQKSFFWGVNLLYLAARMMREMMFPRSPRKVTQQDRTPVIHHLKNIEIKLK